MPMQKITPFLWFDGNAEEATNYYVSIFPDSRITKVMRCGEAGPGPRGSVLAIDFELLGQRFSALNGGPMYTFSPAISFVVNCETQEEVDRYWELLLRGGEALMCGWLKDRFGLSWQITPTVLPDMLRDEDEEKAGRAMRAMMDMQKLDIAALKRAYEGR